MASGASSASRAPHFAWLIGGALAAGIAWHIDAARLDSVALDAVGSGDLVAASQSLEEARAEVAHEGHDQDLQLAAQFVGQVQIGAGMKLGQIRDMLGHLERLRIKVLEIGSFRDPRLRQNVRVVLRSIREKTETLNDVAAQRQAEGEVDDGGEVFPSKRDNICTYIETYYDVDAAFLKDVLLLCRALDDVRSVVLAGEDETRAVFEVSGRLNSLRSQEDYANPRICWEVASVLSEEWRWVKRQLAERPATPGASGKPESSANQPRASSEALDAWVKDVAANSPLDPDIREKRLQDSIATVESINPEEQDTLTGVLTSLQRIQLCKELIVEFVTCGDPEVCERVRALFRVMKEKKDALEALQREKEAAGEVDEVDLLMPSQRSNICNRIDHVDIETAWKDPLRHVCEALDKMRMTALEGGDMEAALMYVVGRLNALKNRPGYSEMPFAGMIEIVFSEEIRWINRESSDSFDS